jgi:UDP-2,4-diacetamido-2,4,6-trideoxy-beta-L-altropyranose hydrolase
LRVVFRTDASREIGSGHVMRCLAFAARMKRAGAEVAFVSRKLEGHLCNLIASQGYAVEDEVPATDWLVVDHYGLDATWESSMRGRAKRILAIDDMANRRHDCDALLDHNEWKDGGKRYARLVPKHCVLWVGARYLLLRDEVIDAARRPRAPVSTLRRVLVFLGGAAPPELTRIVMEGCRGVEVTPLAGTANPRFIDQVKESDLVIGAAGGASWERVALRTPSLVTWYAENQRELAGRLAELGCAESLGDASQLTSDTIARRIAHYQAHGEALGAMQAACERVLPVGLLGTGMDEAIAKMRALAS